MPAEWEVHYGTWTTYPQNPETFFDRLENAKNTFAKMVKFISQSEKVHINVDNEKNKKELEEKLKKENAVKENVFIHIIPTNDAWCRDYGAIFVKNNENQIKGLDFKFNAWGNKYPYEHDDKVASKMCELLKTPCEKIDMVLEGGSIDVNGAGSLLTTESCLLNPNRNPNLSKVQIEQNLKKYFGVEQILWLKEGIVGDDTDGHIDDITRFVNKDTIITAVEENSNDENYIILKENLERLKSFKNLDGKSFNIIELPMPEPQYYDYPDNKNYRLPASYANFYITNKYIIVPTFNCKQDEKALKIIQKTFPDKTVIGIYAYDILIGLGGFHCLTMQIPYFLT